MPANIQNITLAANEWIDLYAETGITVGAAIAIENIGATEVYLSISETEPPKNHDAYNVLRRDSETLRNTAGDPGAWAFSQASGGKIAVRQISTTNGFYPELADVNIGNVTLGNVKLEDTDGIVIDPANESNQQAIIDALDSVTTTEDQASADGQKGVAAMAVSNEAQAEIVDADGDETRIATDKKGTQYVRDEAALAQQLSIDDELVIANSELASIHDDIGNSTDAAATGNGSLIAVVKRIRDAIQDVWESATSRLRVALTDANGNIVNPTRPERTVFGDQVITPRSTQFEVQFHKDEPENLLRVVSKTGSAYSLESEGGGQINSGTDTDVEYILETWEKTAYASSKEIGTDYTVAFRTPPTGADDVLAVRYGDDADAYDLGYFGRNVVSLVGGDAVRFGIRWLRNGALEDFYEIDPAQVLVYRDGALEPWNPALDNVIRIPFGWISTATAYFKIYNPDAIELPDPWSIFHAIKHPNKQAFAQWTTPNKPSQVIVKKVGSDSTDVGLTMWCIAGYIGANVSMSQQPDRDFVIPKAPGEIYRDMTPITAGSSRTSVEFDRDGWETLQFYLATDKPTAENGIQVEYTPNFQSNSRVWSPGPRYTFDEVALQTGFLSIPIPLDMDGARVTIINGAEDQTSLTWVMTLLPQAVVPRNVLKSRITSSSPAVMVRSALFAENDGGAWDLIKRSIKGALRIAVNEHEVTTPIRALSVPAVKQITVGTMPQRIDDPPVAGRKGVAIKNIDASSNVAYGFSSAITYLTASWQMGPGDFEADAWDETVELWAVAENTGGVQTTAKRSGSSAAGTATNPSNALTSNGSRATMDAAGQTLEITGFTAGAANPLVQVRLGIEARKDPAFPTETVTRLGSDVTGQSSGTTLTSASVPAYTDALYVARIGRTNASAAVQAVTGLGLTWVNTGLDAVGAGTRVSMWCAYGTPAAADTVNVQLSASGNSFIVVSPYENADPDDPVENYEPITGSAPSYSDSLIGTQNGLTLVAATADNVTHTPGSGATETTELNVGSGTPSDRLTLAATEKLNASTGAQAYAGTWSASADFAVVAATIRPAPSSDPLITLSYELSAVAGATSGQVAITDTADDDYFVDISGDNIELADIPNIKWIGTLDEVGVADLQADHAFLEVTDTTGNTVRLQVKQGGVPT